MNSSYAQHLSPTNGELVYFPFKEYPYYTLGRDNKEKPDTKNNKTM